MAVKFVNSCFSMPASAKSLSDAGKVIVCVPLIKRLHWSESSESSSKVVFVEWAH